MPSAGSIPIVSLKPVSCGTTLWRSGGVLQVTLVVKATFGMMHEGAARLIAPMPLVLEDRYAQTGSLAEPGDLAPYLPNAGVLLWGHAYAPRPMPAVTIHLAVYRDRPLIDKVLHVFGDRAVAGANPQPFQKISLAYERAHGGPSFVDNPVGTGATPDTRMQPNFVHAADSRKPGGFGPLSSRWGTRRRMLMGRAEPNVDVPDGFDFRWYQAAPSDQQCEYLHGDEWLVLDGMHPTLPRLQTQLPSVRAQAVWVAPGPRGPEGKHLPLSADTLLIDADRQLCSLLWRGHFALEKADALPHLKIFTGVEMPGYPIVWPEEASLEPRAPVSEPEPPDHAPTERIVISRVRAPALPFSKAAPGAEGPRFAAPPRIESDEELPELNATITAPMFNPFKTALPFNKNAPVPLTAPAPPKPAFGDTSTATTSPFTTGLPFAKGSDEPAPPSQAAPASVRTPGKTAWAQEAEDHTRMLDPSMIGVGVGVGVAGSLPFAHMAPSGGPHPIDEPTTAPLGETPWAAARASTPIETSEPGAETIMARADDLRRLPMPGGPPVSPAIVPPPPITQVQASHTPPPAMIAPPAAVAPPPIVEARAISAPPAPSSPPPMMAPPPLVAPPPAPEAPSLSEAPPVSLTGVRATVVQRVKAREALRDLALAGADLTDLDLSGALLSGSDLRGAKLTRAKLVEARLGEAQLGDADLAEADLTRADLTRADLARAAMGLARFDEATLVDANLTGARGQGARFEGARLTRARLSRAELDGAIFSKADMANADLTGASIAEARFEGASMIEVRLSDARGKGAVFDDARLPEAVAQGASLPAASFARADATGSAWESAILDEGTFAGATLKDANFSRASAAGADFTDATLAAANLQRLTADGAKLDRARMDKADLRQARLRDARFAGASMRGVLAGKADLSGARFSRADLEGATLRAARLGGASFAHANLEGADLRDADLDRTNVFGAARKTAKIGTRGLVEIEPGPEGDA